MNISRGKASNPNGFTSNRKRNVSFASHQHEPKRVKLDESVVMQSRTNVFGPAGQALELIRSEMMKYSKTLELITRHEEHIKNLENKNQKLMDENRKIRDLLSDKILENPDMLSRRDNINKESNDERNVSGILIRSEEMNEERNVPGILKPSASIPRSGSVSFMTGPSPVCEPVPPTPDNLKTPADEGTPNESLMPTPENMKTAAEDEYQGTPLCKTVQRKPLALGCPTAPKTGFMNPKSRLIKQDDKRASRLAMLLNEPEDF